MADEHELDAALKKAAARETKRAAEEQARRDAMNARVANMGKAPGLSPTSPQPRDNRDRDTMMIDRDKIDPNPDQPRRRFDADGLKSLGESLRENGQLQALVVRPHPTRQGRYQLVSGERRWLAAGQKYGDVEQLRVTVRELSNEQVLELALIENLQRDDLTALETARGLQSLKVLTRVNDAAMARKTGLSKGRISQLLALLNLDEKVQSRFDELNLNEKHGRALLSLGSDAKAQKQLMQSIESGEMSGNEALRVADSLKAPTPNKAAPASGPSTWTTAAPPPNSGSDVSRETGATAAPASTSGAIQEPARGVGFDQSSAPQPNAYDALRQHLNPALNLLIEAVRRSGEIRARDVADVAAALARIKNEVAALQREIANKKENNR